MKQIVKLLGKEMKTVEIEATVIASLCVHPMIDECDFYVVSHIKSGCFVKTFWTEETAIAFAKEAVQLMDFDIYKDYLVTNGLQATQKHYRQSIDDINALASSYDAVDIESEVTIEDTIAALRSKGNLLT